jgi:NAD(P)-dependent dehydrogenase (short-subunit alcohol dehydrogenase family)
LQWGRSGVKANMRSKNLNVSTTYELARRWADSRITFNTYQPGIVRTGLVDHLGAGKRLAVWLATPLLLSPEQGADTGVWLATSNAMDGVSGRYFVKRREVASAPCTYDTALAVLVRIRLMALLQREAAAA